MVAVYVGMEEMQEPVSCEEKIFVSVRLRPLNNKEIARHDVSDWEPISENTIIHRNGLSVPERSLHTTSYTFDRVFSSDCPNRQVYEEGAKEVALSVVRGINSSVFAYGQTSSGKTYTMRGITEYAMKDIYDYIQRHKERDFILKFSAMEIYNESVKDLLSADSAPLRLLDDPERGTVVEKLTEETLRDSNHFKELLSICEAQRQIGETSVNDRSSRSHQILRVTVESSAREFLGNKSSTLVATVNFVDLAGSERSSQTLAAGSRLKEGSHINRSLLTLGTVIRKLSKGRNGHIPFRDSKLTRIVQSSLGGNARTAIICTMSPARTHVEQSRNTLLFASCAKEVTTKAQVNVVMSDKASMKQLQREFAREGNELRSSRTMSISSDFDALLREKDLEIEKLKKEVAMLTQQRDSALSMVEELREATNNETPRDEKPVNAGPDSQYPKLRVRDSRCLENSIIVGPVLSVGVRSCTPSDVESFSSEESFIRLPDFKLKIPYSSASPLQLSPRIPICVESPLSQDENGDSKSSMNGYSDSSFSEPHPKIFQNSMSSPMGNASVSGVMEVDNEDTSKQESKSFHLIKNIPFASPEETYSCQLKEDICSCRSLRLTRSRSCEARLMTGLTSREIESVEKEENIPPAQNAKNFHGRPYDFHRKFSARKFEHQSEVLSRNESQNSSPSATDDELNRQRSTNESQRSSTSAAGFRAVMEPILNCKTVKDARLDPKADTNGSPSVSWLLEFKRLQREIIELWHVCNVPLVHRTYFFFLLKGDPKDIIYMEVEHRRLSDLTHVFSNGKQMVENGRVLTLSSSEKDLRRERQMLSQRMNKRLSKVERENLFLKWGIGLDTKERRTKLAQLLWSDCKDMEHITESAAVVAKLVDFENPEKTFKEMFGLNFTLGQLTAKTNNALKRIVMSTL